MSRFKILVYSFFCCFCTSVYGQDYFSYGSGNYGGLLQVISNPASAAGNKLKIDVLVGGFDISFNNSWAAVKREAIAFPKLPGSWNNYTPNLEGNIYKNFEWKSNDESREVLLEQRVLLPSVLVRVDAKSSVAFSCSMRQVGNISGITTPLANLFEREFDLSVLQNNPIQSKNFSAVRMSWIEYGFTYARVISDKGNHHFKAGITPKLLQGLEGSYFLLRDLNFLFSNKDTLSYFDADFTLAHSARTSSPLNITANTSEKFRQSSGLGLGLHLGVIYEWYPYLEQHSGKDAPAEKPKRDVAPLYKLKAGLSLVDVGRIKFQKEQNYYDMQLSIRQHDIIRYISAENVQVIDSMLESDFPANTGEDNFRIMMPTAVNTQLDYSFTKNLFLNLSTHLTGFYKSDFFKVRNYSAVCLSPRFESYWIDVSLLLTWNALSASRGEVIVPGVNMRLGFLQFGSTDLSFLYKDNLSSLNFYAMLRVPVVYRRKV